MLRATIIRYYYTSQTLQCNTAKCHKYFPRPVGVKGHLSTVERPHVTACSCLASFAADLANIVPAAWNRCGML